MNMLCEMGWGVLAQAAAPGVGAISRAAAPVQGAGGSGFRFQLSFIHI